MNAFEIIAGQLLAENGYWVRHSVKVDLSKELRRTIGKPSMPRPEIDIAAYSVHDNELILIEVKSFIDSLGVHLRDVMANNDLPTGRYKLITSEPYRRIVTEALVADWQQRGIIRSDTKVCYALFAGKVYRQQEEELRTYLDSMGWKFWGPKWVKENLGRLTEKGYEDNAITIALKIMGHDDNSGKPTL